MYKVRTATFNLAKLCEIHKTSYNTIHDQNITKTEYASKHDTN